jgi:hypothetical protein
LDLVEIGQTVQYSWWTPGDILQRFTGDRTTLLERLKKDLVETDYCIYLVEIGQQFGSVGKKFVWQIYDRDLDIIVRNRTEIWLRTCGNCKRMGRYFAVV